MTPADNPWMLRLAAGRWSLASADEPDAPRICGGWSPAEAKKMVEELTNYFAQEQLAPGPLVFSLESSLCLATQFTVASLRQLRKRETLEFQVEETLPISAEDIVADFFAERREVFAVTAETAVLEPVIVELTRAEIAVEAIVPEVSLAIEEHLQTSTWPARHHVLWLESDHWELVAMDGPKPTNWLRLPATAATLLQSLRAAELVSRESMPIAVYGPPEAIDLIQSQVSADWFAPPPEAVTTRGIALLAGRTVIRILDGQIEPPMQLLRGPLAASVKRRSPLVRELRLLQYAAALLFIVLAITRFSSWQTAQQTLAKHTAGQADVFRKLYPDKRVPVGVQTRLASDLRRLRGVRGETTELPSDVEALQVVHRVLMALPDDMRLRLLEIRVEQGRLSLAGEVRSHGDADRIAAALRKQGLRVSAPSTQQLPQQGVDFRLTAEVAPAEETSV